MSKVSVLRAAVKAKIDADTAGYTIPELTVVETFKPFTRLEDVPKYADATPKAKVSVVALAQDESQQSRSRVSHTTTLQVQVGIQSVIDLNDPNDLTDGNALLDLMEEIQKSCRETSITNYAWLSNVQMRDDNNTPFDFFVLSESSLFQALFTTVFQKS